MTQSPTMSSIETIYKKVLDCSFMVHTTLGPGLHENAYEECLYFELCKAGLKVEKQKTLPLVYKDIHLEGGYRIDLLVEDSIIVEIKAIETITI